jgi:hypothetical protein
VKQAVSRAVEFEIRASDYVADIAAVHDQLSNLDLGQQQAVPASRLVPLLLPTSTDT